jgi:hypothetical protein
MSGLDQSDFPEKIKRVREYLHGVAGALQYLAFELFLSVSFVWTLFQILVHEIKR